MMALLLTFSLWECSDDNDLTDSSEKVAIVLSTPVIQVDEHGGIQSIVVESSENWRLSGVYDWVHPSIISGKNGDEVTFTIDPNNENKERIAIFKFFSGSSVATLRIESAIGYSLKLASASELTIARTEGYFSILLDTDVENLDVNISGNENQWLDILSNTDFANQKALLFKFKENESYKNRVATISISSPLVQESVEVVLTQKKTDVIIVGEEEAMQLYDYEARTITFEVKTNIDPNITIEKGEDWIQNIETITSDMGEDGLKTLTISCDLSSSSNPRGGTIRISENDIFTDIGIIQKKPGTQIFELPDLKLRGFCINEGWVVSLAGDKCLVTDEGMNATHLYPLYPYAAVQDLTGIENFPNLENITLTNSQKMTIFDISKLHKVKSVSVKGKSCGIFNLGDNPITSFSLGGTKTYSSCETLTFIGTKIETIDLSIVFQYESWDSVTSIDVSDCPALKTLNANRGSKVKTLYLKQGQTIENLTKNDVTTIVYK